MPPPIGLPDALTPVMLNTLRASLRGDLLGPDAPEYEPARRVFNAMIDKRPALILRCLGASDVVHGVNFAREHSLSVAVRGGGHSVSGVSTCSAGMVLDLSPMRAVRVDPALQTADVQPGARLGDFDREAHTFGLATTLGIVSNTGVAGLTLGGGIGWLNGRYGLACDNVIAVDIVTADGRLLTANSHENEDLFWAVRGGGGNFGVVTSFRYQLHAVHTVIAGMVLHPLSRSLEVLPFFHQFASVAPDDLSLAAALLSGPDGSALVALAGCYCGDLDEGDRVLQPLRSFGSPVADTFGRMPYVDLQRMLDPAFQPGFRHYWKASFVRTLDDGLTKCAMDYVARKPSPATVVAVQQLHGAAARVPSEATAFPHRRSQYDLGILSVWRDAADDSRNVQWTRDFYQALEPLLEKSVYVNNLGDEGDERVRAAYGSNHERLASVKAKYDPTNFFRHNQNIRPR